MDLFRSTILVCGGTGCTSSGSPKLYERFATLLAEKGMDKEVKLVKTGCFGLCERGPIMIVYPEGFKSSPCNSVIFTAATKEYFFSNASTLFS